MGEAVGQLPKAESVGAWGGYKTPVCYRGGLALFHPSLLPLRGEKAESFAFQGTADFSLP